MASQDPSTAYTAAPEKKSGSWFPSFSLPKLPDFFGTGASSAAPAPAAPVTAVAEQSSVQPGGRRRRSRKMTKKAGRRRRHIRRGGDDEYKPDITLFRYSRLVSSYPGPQADGTWSSHTSGRGGDTNAKD